MIRSWIVITFVVCLTGICAAEDLPAPKPHPADVPAPPAPQLPTLQMPLPDIDLPGDPKPNDAKPADQPRVVAPSVLIPSVDPPKANSPIETAPKVTAPNSAFPQPAPSSVVPFTPNPSGTTPTLPETAVVPTNTPNNNVPNELKWRYKWHNGQWWYWSPDERWMIWEKNSWSIYDPATYQPPAGFAKPGPRVVITQQSTPALPENYSGTEVSTPESTYIQPTPYAFGADSYYGPNGPAASYYNRGSATGLTYGASRYSSESVYVPIYQSYLAPQYFTPRYTAPVGGYPAFGYPGYDVPGYYGGRGVTIGFGF